MESFNVQALILKNVPLKEADVMVVLFSRIRGKMRAIAYGAAKATSRKRAAVQPFTIARLQLKPYADTFTVVQGEAVRCLINPSELDYRRLQLAVHLAELVDRVVLEGEAEPAIFDLLVAVLANLGRGDATVLHLLFKVRLLELLGYGIVLQECAECGQHLPSGSREVRLSLAAGGVICPECERLHGVDDADELIVLSRGALATLQFMQEEKMESCLRLRIAPALATQLHALIDRFAAYHLDLPFSL